MRNWCHSVWHHVEPSGVRWFNHTCFDFFFAINLSELNATIKNKFWRKILKREDRKMFYAVDCTQKRAAFGFEFFVCTFLFYSSRCIFKSTAGLASLTLLSLANCSPPSFSPGAFCTYWRLDDLLNTFFKWRRLFACHTLVMTGHANCR